MAKPIVAIGQMRHRARFERWIEVPDALDNVKREYRLLQEVWGALTPIKPNKNLSGAQVTETGSHLLTVWWQAGLIVQEDHMRVAIDGKAFRILNHIETNETRRRIEITLDVTHENAQQCPAYDNAN